MWAGKIDANHVISDSGFLSLCRVHISLPRPSIVVQIPCNLARDDQDPAFLDAVFLHIELCRGSKRNLFNLQSIIRNSCRDPFQG